MCILHALFLSLSIGEAAAQQTDFARISSYFSSLADFDYRYPREQVYLHLDNNGYFQDETLWFKAYVVRASTLCPDTTLSRVLYVELLDADGELVERKLLHTDTLGQAHGEFSLALPVRGGHFYEVRAYTREMLNWGENAYFSRVIPVFKKQQNDAAQTLEILRPESNAELTHNHPRPYHFGKKHDVRLTFYPEGGKRVKGVSSRIAYELKDGRGVPQEDTIYIYNKAKEQVLSTYPLHQGMGSFVLPAEVDEAYAMVRGKRVELPACDASVSHTLTVQQTDELHVIVSRSPDATPELLGLAVMCRDQALYFDTLTVGNLPVEIIVDEKLLGDGVNRIELFNARGETLARRLFWGPPTTRKVSVHFRQNERSYDAFSPIAIECQLQDAYGKPVQTVFSLAVREAESEVVASPEAELSTELLLSSELRGYVASPSWYFESEDDVHRQALDNLLLVQGWTANSFAHLAGVDAFKPIHPIEDRLILQGRILKNNDREQGRAGVALSLHMFNQEGYSLQSQTFTDSLGGFSFVSNVDYTGDWVGQFTTRLNGKPVWSRVALNRWFSLQPRSISAMEMEILPPVRMQENFSAIDASTNDVELFEWNDTLPKMLVDENIGTAVVTYRGYRGFRGNRYSYQGGEQAGLQRASVYYNIEQTVEQIKDAGGVPGSIWEVLRDKDHGFDFSPGLDPADSRYARLLEAVGDTNGGIATQEVYMFTYNGRPALVFVDNELFMQLYKGDDPHIFADEVKSVLLMHNSNDWRRFLPGSVNSISDVENLHPTAIFLYTRPDFQFFRTKKGIEKRTIHGYATPAAFYEPNYRGIDMPSSEDHRRTLYWNPTLRSDTQGKATAVFFSNSHEKQTLSFSARGITKTGGLLWSE